MREDSQRLMRRLALTLVLGLAAILVVAASMSLIRLPLNQVETSMIVAVESTTSDLKLHGRTNLPDGAIVDCEAWHSIEDSPEGRHEWVQDIRVTVIDGSFDCAFDVANWPAGEVRLDSRFVPYDAEQPASIQQTFGASGERLSGPQVVQDSDGWIVEVFQVVARPN